MRYLKALFDDVTIIHVGSDGHDALELDIGTLGFDLAVDIGRLFGHDAALGIFFGTVDLKQGLKIRFFDRQALLDLTGQLQGADGLDKVGGKIDQLVDLVFLKVAHEVPLQRKCFQVSHLLFQILHLVLTEGPLPQGIQGLDLFACRIFADRDEFDDVVAADTQTCLFDLFHYSV